MNYYHENYYDSSLFYIKKSLIENEKSKTLKPHILYYNLSLIYHKLNLQDSALQFINTALKDIRNEKIIDANYADILFQKGIIVNNHNSNELFDEALNVMKKISGIKHSRTAYLYKEIGLLKFKHKLYKESLNNFQQALISVDREFNSPDIFKNPECISVLSYVYLSKTLQYKTEALEHVYLQTDSLKYLIAAYETSRLLTNQLEKMLTTYPLFESREFLIQNSSASFIKAQKLGYICWLKTKELKYKNENILLAEKSRAAILKSQIQDNEFNNSVLNDSVANELHEIEQHIAYITGQINENSANNKAFNDELKNQLFELKEQKNKLSESYKGEYGNFSNYFKNSTAMSFDEILNFPAENELVLEYSLCDSIILLNVVEKGKHELFEIAYDSSLQQKIDRFKKLIVPDKIVDVYITDISEINKLGTSLYDIFLKPVGDKIKSKQLLIVQEPKLGFIPFDALISNGKYLIEYQPISYLYSINISHNAKQIKHVEIDNKMAAFFPDYEPNSNKLTSYAAKYYKSLKPLDYKNESEAISQITACDTFLVNNATEENFKKLAGNYTILHLALHSILNPENFLLSKLCFTPVKDSLNDGLFNLCDVAPLRLHSKLTVLSGCNTGSGQVITGEGVMSFARSFILAGSSSILMSLWELNNNSAIEINSGFYKYLTEGNNKAEALRLSKLDYIKKSDQILKLPFFWAGIVLIGDKEHIEIPKRYSIIEKIGLGAGILLIVLIIFMIIKKRKLIFRDNYSGEEDEGSCCC